MNYKYQKYSSAESAFNELFIPNYENLKTLQVGKILKNIGLRPRELLGLCLMCFLAKYLSDNKWTIGIDPFGRDGLLVRDDAEERKRGIKRGMIIEQVYIKDNPKTTFVQSFERALEGKLLKGANYRKNLNLVILTEYGNKEDLIQIINYAQKSDFESVYLFILNKPIPYKFEVAILKSPGDPLEYYYLGINPIDGSAKILKKGFFHPEEVKNDILS